MFTVITTKDQSDGIYNSYSTGDQGCSKQTSSWGYPLGVGLLTAINPWHCALAYINICTGYINTILFNILHAVLKYRLNRHSWYERHRMWSLFPLICTADSLVRNPTRIVDTPMLINNQWTTSAVLYISTGVVQVAQVWVLTGSRLPARKWVLTLCRVTHRRCTESRTIQDMFRSIPDLILFTEVASKLPYYVKSV